MHTAAIVLILASAAAFLGPAPPAARAAAPSAIPDAARKACFDGKWLLVQNRYDEAIGKLQLALDLWPDYPEAQTLLDQAKARRIEPQQRCDKAAALLRESKWDEALREAEAALRLFPAFAEAKSLLDQIRRGAAEAHLAAGHARLDASDAAGADAAYRAALGYLPGLEAAREGLARTAARRSEAAAAAGRWGAALAWAMEAVEQAPKPTENWDRVRALRPRVFQAARFSLGPEAAGGTAPSATTADLRAAVWRRLAQDKPDFVTLQPGPGQAQAPTFAAGIEAGPLDIRTGQVRVENRTHTYTARREEPNPEYARLRDLLDVALANLGRLRAECNRPCLLCRSTGLVLCRNCAGTGAVGGAPCPVCAVLGGRPGWSVCPQCGGTGRWSGVSEWELRRQELEVARLQSRLAREPLTIVRQVSEGWPYVVEHHEKTATLEAGIRVTLTATGAAVHTDAVRRHRRSEDTAIQNPRPELGLRPDPLELPADEALRQALIDETAEEAAAKILAGAVGARAATLQAEAERLFSEGKAAEATEAAATAAALREAVDRDEGRRMMARLRDRLRALEQGPAGGAPGR